MASGGDMTAARRRMKEVISSLDADERMLLNDALDLMMRGGQGQSRPI